MKTRIDTADAREMFLIAKYDSAVAYRAYWNAQLIEDNEAEEAITYKAFQATQNDVHARWTEYTATRELVG